jgi:small nuclear ribonucleoprotein (snRNP)-like protein
MPCVGPSFADEDQAYDGHLNMVLSDVEETVTIVEVEEENEDPTVRVCSLHDEDP